jgi:hypothetical protein
MEKDRMKHLWVIALLLASSFAAAQVPSSGNVYFGYTYYNTDLSLNRGSLNGWQGALEGKVFPMLGIVADLTGHYGTLSFNILCPPLPIPEPPPCGPVSSNAHVYEAMFGPRVSIPIGRFRPFAEFELGVAHATTGNAGLGTDTSFATALGGGVDLRLFRPVAWRVEGDYVRTDLFHATQGNFRFSTGIVLRF